LVAPVAFDALRVTVAPAQLLAFVDTFVAVTEQRGTPEIVVVIGSTVIGVA
jgi:hypothetical protein